MCVVLTLAVVYLLDANRKAAQVDKAAHAKCIAHVADITSNRIVALALRDLAQRYDSVEGRRETQTIANREWTEGGPSIPALFILRQADALDPRPDPDSGEYRFDGSRVL